MAQMPFEKIFLRTISELENSKISVKKNHEITLKNFQTFVYVRLGRN
jgi:hypothetical protein